MFATPVSSEGLLEEIGYRTRCAMFVVTQYPSLESTYLSIHFKCSAYSPSRYSRHTLDTVFQKKHIGVFSVA